MSRARKYGGDRWPSMWQLKGRRRTLRAIHAHAARRRDPIPTERNR